MDENLFVIVFELAKNYLNLFRWNACEGDRCYGGWARRATAVKQYRLNNKNVLLLDAGDQSQGTPWYTDWLS